LIVVTTGIIRFAVAFAVLAECLGAGGDVFAQSSPSLTAVDRLRIREGRALAQAVGNRVWQDWDRTPFPVLLVTADHEFLIGHAQPSDEFALVGEDAELGGSIFVRERQYSPKLLATFPAVGGISTIVIGQAEQTMANTSTRWVVTLLHEHFHQLQNSRPGYYDDVNALGLAGNDETGMWMLNYPFPYSDPDVGHEFAAMCRALDTALQARGQADFADKTKSYLDAKARFRELLSAEDYRYFAFQTWQEGIARYTEFRVAELAASDFQPSAEFRELPDFTAFAREAQRIVDQIHSQLADMHLDQSQRTAFYAVGAAEGLVLDELNPDWREHYWDDMFSLDGHFRTSQ
jgi:hypothetical protein